LLREKPGASHVALVEETFTKLVLPVVTTSLTGVIGFLSFASSPLGPVRSFGVVTAVGALFGLFYSLTVVPALLVLLKPGWLRPDRRRPGQSTGSVLSHAFGSLGPSVVRGRWWVAGATAALLALTPLGLCRLTVQDSWTNAFDPASAFRRATRLVNEQFHGMHLLFVSVEAPKVLAGEFESSALSADVLTLPATLGEDAKAIAGSAIKISFAAGASNRLWQSHIEMVSREGDRVSTRLAPKPAPAGFWEDLRKAGRGRYEIVVRTHVQPELIRRLGDLASFIRQRPQDAVGGVLGPADYLLTTRFMTRPNDPEARRLPQDPVEAKLMWDFYGLALGPQRLRQLVDTNYWQSLTTVFLKDANFVDTARLMRAIQAYAQEKLAPQGCQVGFAGDVAVSQSLIHGIVRTQLHSLFWSLLGIFVVTAVLGGSWRFGVWCLLPSLLAVVIKFAVMGWVGIPLGVATSMFAAMTLGLGVNCAIHLLEGCRQAQAGGALPAEALGRSLALTGPPALINTLAVSLGFGVLMLSQVPANARLGMLVVLGLVNCFGVSLLLLPVLLHWWPLKVREASASSPASSR